MDVILAQLSVVSSIAQMDVLNQKTNLVESPKHERRLRTKRSVPSRSASKTESSGSSSDTPMHDECDACDEIKGKLITCDSCFGAFHVECLNPSLSREELERSQDGEAVCSYCASSMCASKAVSPSNSDILEGSPWGSPKRSPKVSRSADSSPSNTPKSKRKKPVVEKVCECCEQSGTLVSCNQCYKSYHSYCIEPPLLKESILWQCPDHQMNVDIVPNQTFKLNFQPEEWTAPRVSSLDEHQSMDKSLCDEEKDQTLQSSTDQPEHWLMELSQERVYSDHSISISPLMLDDLSPSFVKFLAWQRLSQMYKEWHYKKPISKTPSS